MWSRHAAFIRGAWFNRLHQARDGQFALKNWALTTWKIWPFQFEKVQQPCRLSWKLSAKYFMSFDASTAVAPPLCINHIFCQNFFEFGSSAPFLSPANKGQQFFREHMFLLGLVSLKKNWLFQEWMKAIQCLTLILCNIQNFDISQNLGKWTTLKSIKFIRFKFYNKTIKFVSSILRQNLSRFAYFEGYFLRSLLDCIFFRFSRIDYSRQESLVLYYVISNNPFKKFLIAMTSNLVPMINFGTYPT